MRGRLAVLLGVTAVLALSAGPASAEGAITSPGPGTVYTQDDTVEITARVDGRPVRPTTELRLTDPLGRQRTVATAAGSLSATDLRYALRTDCPAFPDQPCNGVPALNGTWTAVLSGGGEDSKQFVLRIPPRAPELTDAVATGSRAVVLTWVAGAEPDLRGYSVVDGSGAELAAVPPTACTGGTCTHTVTFAEDGPREDALAVRAVRGQCPDCEASLASAPSAARTVARPAPGATPSGSADPSAAPSGTAAPGSPAPGDPGPSGAASSPSAAGPTTSAPVTPGVGALGRTDGPGLEPFGGVGDAELPSLLGSAAPTADGPSAQAAPLPDGTFAPTLPFADQVVREPVAAPSPAPSVAAAVQQAARRPALVNSVAAALVLLLVGAHLRRWATSS